MNKDEAISFMKPMMEVTGDWLFEAEKLVDMLEARGLLRAEVLVLVVSISRKAYSAGTRDGIQTAREELDPNKRFKVKLTMKGGEHGEHDISKG